SSKAEELSQKVDKLVEKLGPEYIALVSAPLRTLIPIPKTVRRSVRYSVGSTTCAGIRDSAKPARSDDEVTCSQPSVGLIHPCAALIRAKAHDRGFRAHLKRFLTPEA